MNVKKILSILLIITIILPILTVSAGAQTVSVPAASQTGGINYDVTDVIVTGTVDGNAVSGYSINLTNETITVPSDYKITAYSINDGKSWTALSSKTTFNNSELAKLFSKDFTLAVTDKYDSKAKKPASDAKTVKFAKINKRPDLKSYYVNYLIGADSTGETSGTWVLTEKNGTNSVKENIDIAVSDSAGKAPDSKGYGKFYGGNGTTNGIEIAELPADGKAVSKYYFIRSSAKANSDGTYTSASKSSKITVKGQSKPSTYKVSKTQKNISYAANTYVFINKTELQTSKGTINVSKGGDIYLWSAATASAPASAKQKTSVTASGSSIVFTNSTVTKLPKTAVFQDADGNKTNKGSYKKGTKTPFTFTVEKDLSEFESVEINGKTLIKDKDYTVKSGSTIITLSESYLGELAFDEYSLSVNFTDSSVTRYFTVDEQPVAVQTANALIGIMPLAIGTTPDGKTVNIVVNPSMITLKEGNTTTFSATIYVDGVVDSSQVALWGFKTTTDNKYVAIGPNVGNFFSVSGILAPTPSSEITIEVWSMLAPAAKETITITVEPKDAAEPPKPPKIYPKDAPGSTEATAINLGTIYVEEDFNYTFIIAEGTAPIVWSYNGTPIAGLESSITNFNGSLYGKPTTAADYTFSIVASNLSAYPNDGGTDIKYYKVKVLPRRDTTITVQVKNGKGGTIKAAVLDASGKSVETKNSNSIVVVNSGQLEFSAVADAGYRLKQWTDTQRPWDGSAWLASWIPSNPIDTNKPNEFSTDKNYPTQPLPSELPAILNSQAPRYTTLINGARTVTVEFELITPQITTNSLTDGEKYEPYNYQLAGKFDTINIPLTGSNATDFTAKWDVTSFTAKSTSLANSPTELSGIGLALDQNGKISGTATASGVYEIEVQLTVSDGINTAASTKKTFTLTITGAGRVEFSVVNGNGNLKATTNGTQIASGTYVNGTVLFTAEPSQSAPGYQVKNWKLYKLTESNGAWTADAGTTVNGQRDTYTLTITDNVRVEVEFEPKQTTSQMDITRADGNNSTVYLPDATQGVNYEFLFDIDSKGVPYQYAIWSTTIPTALNDLTLDQDTGKLSGIPKASAGYTQITVKATVYSQQGNVIGTPQKVFQIRILKPVPLEISPTLPDGVNGIPYSALIQYTGNTATKWELVAPSTLPSGLSLDTATGKIHGTPNLTDTLPKTFTFKVKGTNEAGDKEQDITVTIRDSVPPSDIQPASLPDATMKIPYSQTLTASGLPNVFTWEVSDGSLPAGLFLTPDTGAITGTPAATGIYTFTVRAANGTKDAGGNLVYATKDYTINVKDLIITASGSSGGTVNEPYSYKFTLNGNESPNVTWSWTAATGFTLPKGLDLNQNTGEITGTPTVAGTYRFNVKATDNNKAFEVSGQFTITINLFSPPVITSDDVLYGEVGVPFWEVIGVEGNPPIEWEWTDSTGGKANLPQDLFLSDLDSSDPVKTQYGIISGTPTKATTYNVIVSAISGRDTSSKSVGTKNITIIIRGSINVTSITGIPTEATTGRTITLQATVNPSDATYQSIIWTMATMEEIVKDIEKTAGSLNAGNLDIWITELRNLLKKAGISQSSALLNLTDNEAFISKLASLVGVTVPANPNWLNVVSDIIKKAPPYGDTVIAQNNLRKNAAGVVWLKATIKNGNSDNNMGGNPDFVRYFPLEFKEFVPVFNITGVPTEAETDVPLTLTGTVSPYTATNTTIVWEIKWTDIAGGVKLQNGVLTAPGAGNVMVTARISKGTDTSPATDYTKDFLIKVAPPTPVLKVTEPQSNTPETGTAGKVTYAVETKYIADGVYNIKLTSPHTGITLDSTTNIQIKNGKGTLTVHYTDKVPANVYSLSVELQNAVTTDKRTVNAVLSNKFAFRINSPPDPIPPSIIRPSEITDGEFPPKEIGGSLRQLYLPNGSMNVQYNETLMTAGFESKGEAGNEIIPPTYWRVIGGSLPPGLTLTQWIEGKGTSVPSGSTGWDTGYARAGCVIEGKPTETGVGKLYTFILEADEIMYFQQGTTVVWKKEGYDEWIKKNPSAEKITWNSGANVVVFSGKKAVRTISILVETKIYYPATDVTIAPSTLKVPLGGTESLAANVASKNTGAPQNTASIQNVTWQTNNPRVATVDSYGNVYGLSEGTAIITATTYDKNITAAREVTVYNTPVTAVSVNKSTMTLTVGAIGVLTPTVRPTGATNKAVAYDSSDLNIATIDEYGRIRAVGEGKATITVTTMGVKADGSPATSVCTVTVQNAPAVRATKVSVNKTATKLTVGSSETLKATILPANASNGTVTWRSSNADLVSVDPVTGEITAIAVTKTPVTITAKADQSGTAVEAQCKVTVEEAPPAEKISINKTAARLIVGESDTLTTVITPASASKRTVTWSSSDPNLVSVNPVTGKVTAIAVTKTPVTVTAKIDQSGTAVTVQCKVTVDAAPVITDIALNKSAAVIPVGMTEMLTATLTPVHSLDYNRDNLIWRSLDNNIAVVDSKGNVTGRTVGTTVIEVGTTNGLTAQCAIQVMPLSTVVQTFVDVNSSEWYFPYISQAVSYGLVNGVGNNTFAPQRNVTRAEFVTMVVRSLNLTSQKSVSNPFKDVKSGDWYYNYLKIALAEGLLTNLTSGEDSNFYPNRAIRREEMASILAAAARKQGLTAALSPSNTLANPTNPDIKDSKLVTKKYAEDVALVYKLGLMNGYPDGTFDPQGVSTRAQAATVMVRLYFEVARFF